MLHQCPGGQVRQPSALLSPSASLKAPLGHCVGAELPTAHQAEAGHTSQAAVAPSAGWKVPAAQRSQRLLPVRFAKLPVLHGVCLPEEHQWPSGQSSHSSTLVMRVRFDVLPGGHGVATGEPCGQYVPGSSQGAGVTVAPEQAKPAGQAPEHTGLL